MDQVLVWKTMLILAGVVTLCPMSALENGDRAVDFAQLHQGSEESCILLHSMDVTMCDVAGNSSEVRKESVPEGTTCMLDPEGGDLSVMECVRKSWVYTASGLRGTRSLATRERRDVGLFVSFSILTGILHCALFCHKKQNTRPSITCPSFPKVIYPDKGHGVKKVTWSPAVARDEEDGHLSTYMTSGEKPGNYFSEGTYQISYIAKDSRGLTQSCTSQFSIGVHRCSRFYTFMMNGEVSCTAYTVYGSICTYSCNPGYKLTGSSYSECLQTWTNSKPICKENSCGHPSPVMRGKLSCSDYTYNAECGVLCDLGYNLNGSSSITCQSDKQWTSPGQCIDVMPPTVHCNKTFQVRVRPHQTHANVTWEMPHASDNSGQNVRVTSEPESGVSLTVGTHRVTFTGVDTAGLRGFCHMTVDVQVIKCNASESSPDFANVTCSLDNVYGSECSVVCFQGYELEGDAKRICQEIGIWSGKPAKCKGRPCFGLPSVAGGHYDCPHGQGYQDRCSLVCNDGYKSISPLTVTCNIDGSWTPAGSCIDIQAPIFPDGCPADMRVPAGQLGRTANVTYELPDVTDNSGQTVIVQAEPPSGSEFDLGLTNVTVTALDVTGNQAICQFFITVENTSCDEPNFDNSGKLMLYDCPDKYVFGATCFLRCSDGNPVQGDQTIICDKSDNRLNWTWQGNIAPFCKPDICSKLKEPKNGAVTCDSVYGGRSQQCIVTCNDNYMYPKTASDMYMCLQKNGQWTNGGYMPDCLPRRKANRVLARPSFHYSGSSCYENNTEIKKKLTGAVLSSTFKDACTGGLRCTVNSVTVFCITESLDKLKMEGGHVMNEFVVEIYIGTFKDKASTLETMEFYNSVVEQISSILILETTEDGFNLPEVGNFRGFGNALPLYECDPGTLMDYRTMSCAGCGEGYYYESTTKSCIACPLGTYQGNEVSFSCTQCPSGTMTRDPRSVSEHQCIVLCKPGETSSTGMQPCQACPRGSYQAKLSMTHCELCPFGMTTASEGSASKLDCQFYNIRMSKEASQLLVQLSDPNPDSFTFMMWVHPVSTNYKMILTFTLDSNLTKTGSAYFFLGGSQLFVTLHASLKIQSVRKWYHVAFVCTRGRTILYVQGKEVETVNFQVRDLKLGTFLFSPSDSIQSIVITGVQMTASALSREQVLEFSVSSKKLVENNILIVREVDTTLVSPSTCDDIDDCLEIPCGEFGTCIDEPGQYICVCDEPWSGEICQVVPDFCLDHKCPEWSHCVNNPRERSYTCACAAGYKGAFCQEKIVNGNWGMWGEWRPCSVTCGSGKISRVRECNNPRPDKYGEDCPGSGTEHQDCEEKSCAVNGGWSEWSGWACSVTCGNGTAKRRRECNSPPPSSGGLPCMGERTIIKACKNKTCPVNGKYGEWSEWSQCSMTCGGGSSRRSRVCDSPLPSNGGRECDRSQAVERRICNSHVCPVCRELTMDTPHKTFTCVYDKKNDMKNCSITCKPGMVMLPDELNEFRCGRLTNYTWSHQNRDNPTGRLPTCTDVKIPASQRSELNIQFDNIDCSDPPPVSDFKNSVNNNLEQTISCVKNGDCNNDVKINLACGKRTQSTENGYVEAMVIIEVPHRGKHDSYLRFLTEEELNAQMNRLFLIENMTLQLMNQYVQIAKASVSGTLYTGEVKSAKMEVICHDGSGYMNGVCVDCPAGSYSDGSGSCHFCSRGFYQDLARMNSCIQCQEGLNTSGLGSTSRNDCMADPLDYMDYFDWAFDDVYELQNTTAFMPPESVSVYDDKLIIGIVVAIAFFLAVLCTWTTLVTVRHVSKHPEKEPSVVCIYENEIYQRRVPPEKEQEGVYDLIDLDSVDLKVMAVEH